MGLLHRFTRSSKIHDDVADRFRRYLASGCILDLPAGKGENSRGLIAGGFEVHAADLYPDKSSGAGFPVDRVDLTGPLPYADASFDGVLFSEGVEHLDAQVAALEEMARVLKPGGVLIVTTPNVLHLEGRLTQMLTGHPYRNRSIAVHTAAYWGGEKPREPGTAATYFGHVFLINAFQLRFYITHVGLEVVEVDTTRYSWKSIFLAPILFPFVWLGTRDILANKRSRIPRDLQRRLLREVTSPAVLFGRKLIMVARKPGPA